MPSVHSRLSASAAHRWIPCPGSVYLSEQCPKAERSTYAAEGTAAHTLGEQALAMDMNAGDFIGHEIDGFEVDTDMAEAVQVYLDFVRAVIAQSDTSDWAVEHRFELLSIHPQLGGTTDFLCYFPDSQTLVIADYKHGKGVVVEPEANPQLMIYALGALNKLQEQGKAVKQVRIVVVQPRARHDSGPVREWWISGAKLVEWGQTTLKRAADKAAGHCCERTCGEWCRFCPAMAMCPEHRQRAIEVARADFATMQFPDPETMTPDHIAKVIKFSEMMSEWIQGLKAFAQSRMEAGQPIPGYKLVRKRSVREWENKELTELSLRAMLGEGAYKRKLLSPAQAEKELKALGIPKENLENLWVKPDKGLVMAEESDKREAVVQPAAVEFVDSLDFLQ
jgi:hypothetical protein